MANYNLIPPVTTYPYITLDVSTTTEVDEFVTNAPYNSDADASDGFVGAYADYNAITGLRMSFLLAIILPYVASAVKGQESSITEKQLYLQEFMMNARIYKTADNIKLEYLQNKLNNDLDLYQLGENVYLTDFTTAPFAGEWSKASAYKEVTFFKADDNKLYKVVDDSKVDENWQAIIDEEV